MARRVLDLAPRRSQARSREGRRLKRPDPLASFAGLVVAILGVAGLALVVSSLGSRTPEGPEEPCRPAVVEQLRARDSTWQAAGSALEPAFEAVSSTHFGPSRMRVRGEVVLRHEVDGPVDEDSRRTFTCNLVRSEGRWLVLDVLADASG